MPIQPTDNPPKESSRENTIKKIPPQKFNLTFIRIKRQISFNINRGSIDEIKFNSAEQFLQTLSRIIINHLINNIGAVKFLLVIFFLGLAINK